MPFEKIVLNDGRVIPQIGFGSWKIPKEVCTGEAEQAIEVGFDHLDTAQAYRNEEEVGLAIKESGLARKELWITTKWSGTDDKGPIQSCAESLEKIGVEWIDLYLVHHPRLCKGDIAGTWKQMEQLCKEGKVKSIGVSNFEEHDLKELLASCSIKPVVNQILLHPYVIKKTTPLLEFQAKHHIVAEGYSTLIPLTSAPGGPVDKPVNKIAERLNVAPEQVLLAWSKAKHAVLVTTSSKRDRLERYLKVADIDLTEDDVEAIDHAGAKGAKWYSRQTEGTQYRAAKIAAAGVLGLYLLYRTCFC